MSAGYAPGPGYRSDSAPPCTCRECGPGPGIDFQRRYALRDRQVSLAWEAFEARRRDEDAEATSRMNVLLQRDDADLTEAERQELDRLLEHFLHN